MGVLQQIGSGQDWWGAKHFYPSGIEIENQPTFYDSGAITVEYLAAAGAESDAYTQAIPKAYQIRPTSALELIPGSVRFTVAKYAGGSAQVTDNINGKLYRDISGVTGSGVEVGSVDWSSRTLTINDDELVGRTISITHGSARVPAEPVSALVFRAPGAPIRTASISIRGTTAAGELVEGTGDFDGLITGTKLRGAIDYQTGIGIVQFGEMVTDDAEAQAAVWYDADLRDTVNGTVLKPLTVLASTVLINCVITSYLPLDETLLGLNPVRLPIDGRVPIFRDGYVILVHHTQQYTLPNPLSSGQVVTLPRSGLSLIELYDATGQYVYDADTYTVDLAAGTVTMADPLDLSGYTQPLVALHRIEDMCLCADVQVTGHMALTNPLTHDYPAGETMVSSVLPSRDLQSRVYGEFTQASWTTVWSDDRIGSGTTANYDLLNYPIEVTNAAAIKERFAIIFQSTDTVNVVGEHLGVIQSLVSISVDIAPINPMTGSPYFTIKATGWGSGWAAGNVLRFNCDAANFPYWFVRTTLQAPPTEPTDHYRIQLRGDTA